MSQVSLITVTHDPNGKNIALYKMLKDELQKIYSGLYITTSEDTSIDLIDELETGNFIVKVILKKGAANARREVLDLGLNSSGRYFHYCDFDRLLTWASKHTDELRRVVQEIPNYNYLIIGRTEKALYTHPIEWIETEKISNKIFSLQFGQDVDITAGSSSFTRESAEYINKYSNDKMTDAECPMIIHRIAKIEVGYRAVDGLEYHEEINGYSRIISETEKWFGRLKLCYIISESSIKTGKP